MGVMSGVAFCNHPVKAGAEWGSFLPEQWFKSTACVDLVLLSFPLLVFSGYENSG